jgi:hypothetical protein
MAKLGPWTSFNGFKPHHTDTSTVPVIAFAVLIVLLMIGAESTRNM